MPSHAAADYGDYAADSDTEDDIKTEAEPWARYSLGLYYPIRIGEVLDNRYRIEHKLGWGGFSTVWLAQDIKCNVAVALKVLVPGEGQRELDIHNKIAARVPDALRSGFLTCRSSFFLRRGQHNDRHLVLVFPVRGPNLRDTLYKTPPAQSMPVAKQILVPLKALHRAGLIHRDLTLANVMWHVHPIDRMTTKERYRRFGRPQKLAIEDTGGDGKPGDLVMPISWKAFAKDLIPGAACIGDFGLTISADQDGLDKLASAGLPEYRAPEGAHQGRPSFATDVWSFMVIFTNLYVKADALWGGGSTGTSLIVGLLGPFPKGWKELYNGGDPALRKDWWYSGGGDIPQSTFESLEDKIDRLRPDISKRERAYAISFIRRGFTYSPEHRPTAAQLLEDPSFKALMGYYGC